MDGGCVNVCTTEFFVCWKKRHKKSETIKIEILFPILVLSTVQSNWTCQDARIKHISILLYTNNSYFLISSKCKFKLWRLNGNEISKSFEVPLWIVINCNSICTVRGLTNCNIQRELLLGITDIDLFCDRSFENETTTLGRNVEHPLSMMVALHPRKTGTSSTPLRMLKKIEDFTVLSSPFSVFCAASFRNVLSENFWFFLPVQLAVTLIWPL